MDDRRNIVVDPVGLPDVRVWKTFRDHFRGQTQIPLCGWIARNFVTSPAKCHYSIANYSSGEYMLVNFQAFEREVKQINEVISGQVSIMFSDVCGKVTLESIWSEQERGKGHASKAMRSVIEIADKYGIDIYSQPHALRYDTETQEESGLFSEAQIDLWDRLNETCLSNIDLLEWYRRLGFELTGATLTDDPEIMREANAPAPKIGM
jgi:hypothetical protein